MGRPTFVILAEGAFGPESSKTATGAIRYLPGRIRSVIDSTRAGQTVQEVLGYGGETPVVESLSAALATTPPPTALLIGIAPQGGELPEEWRAVLNEAIDAGLELWSGLHTHLSADPELAERARAAGVEIHDLRRTPRDLPVGRGLALSTDAFRVLTVGTDCNVGKMTTALEVREILRRRGVRATFAGTGQTGILIDGKGIAVDAVIADFVAGAAERLTLDAARDADLVLVEGQGSLLHPGYSSVTLGLVHGCLPQAMILGWMPSRPHIYGGRHDWVKIPPLDEVVRIYEDAVRWVAPELGSSVVGIAANTHDLPAAEARRHMEEAAELTGLPVTDPVRDGAEPLADALMAAAGLEARAG